MSAVGEWSDAAVLRLAWASDRRGRDSSPYWTELVGRFGINDRAGLWRIAAPSNEPWSNAAPDHEGFSGAMSGPAIVGGGSQLDVFQTRRAA